MLSLDEPLDLKLPRRANGRDRGARSPPPLPAAPQASSPAPHGRRWHRSDRASLASFSAHRCAGGPS
ncbi:zinc finger protein GLIS2 isoform X1 [Lates japonicus]